MNGLDATTVPAWTILRRADGPIVATAIHQGHDLRPAVAALANLDHAQRRREEDPYTGTWTAIGDTAVLVHRSRFEVDLNRPRDGSVYREPEDAWGLDLWTTPPSDDLVAESRALHDAFYSELETLFAAIAQKHGGFVLYDIHSYNHRRDGPEAPPAPSQENPEVNLGTGTLDRTRWGGVVEAFVAAAKKAAPDLDLRENVKFQGGHLARWVHARFPGQGCALAIEFKKTFMDEWSDRPDPARIEAYGRVLRATVGPVRAAFAAAVGAP